MSGSGLVGLPGVRYTNTGPSPHRAAPPDNRKLWASRGQPIYLSYGVTLEDRIESLPARLCPRLRPDPVALTSTNISRAVSTTFPGGQRIAAELRICCCPLETGRIPAERNLVVDPSFR
jgi:hypothetical protein